jgi:hypothetical protein
MPALAVGLPPRCIGHKRFRPALSEPFRSHEKTLST